MAKPFTSIEQNGNLLKENLSALEYTRYSFAWRVANELLQNNMNSAKKPKTIWPEIRERNKKAEIRTRPRSPLHMVQMLINTLIIHELILLRSFCSRMDKKQ